MSRNFKPKRESSGKDSYYQVENGVPTPKQSPFDYQSSPRDQRSPLVDRDPGQTKQDQLDEVLILAEKNNQLVKSQVKPRVDLQAIELRAKDQKIAELEAQVKNLSDDKRALQAEIQAMDEELRRMETKSNKPAMGDHRQVLSDIVQRLKESNQVLEGLVLASS
jgi:molecular chaperone GrpE (heat shock protein)